MTNGITSTKRRKLSKISLTPGELHRLFNAISKFSDALEDILEEKAEYNPNFLRSLNKSIREMREGKLISLKSLSDLR